MTAWRFTHNARVLRRVAIGTGGTVAVVDLDPPGSGFGAQLITTTAVQRSEDPASPRRRTSSLRYRDGVLEPAGGPLGAGDRVVLGEDTYEVLSAPREVRTGRSIRAFEVPILKIGQLYPFVGDLQEQGGAEVTPDVNFSVYAADETHLTTGTYEDYQAETDISHHDECRINRQIDIGTAQFKITAAEVDLVGAFVRMTVRKSGRG